jgi:hypothetical protein
MPPNIAVGRLCQRSDFGFATKPYRTANVLTANVNAVDNMAAVMPINTGFCAKPCIVYEFSGGKNYQLIIAKKI